MITVENSLLRLVFLRNLELVLELLLLHRVLWESVLHLLKIMVIIQEVFGLQLKLVQIFFLHQHKIEREEMTEVYPVTRSLLHNNVSELLITVF